jgi:predicted metalloprotease
VVVAENLCNIKSRKKKQITKLINRDTFARIDARGDYVRPWLFTTNGNWSLKQEDVNWITLSKFTRTVKEWKL